MAQEASAYDISRYSFILVNTLYKHTVRIYIAAVDPRLVDAWPMVLTVT